MKATHCKICQQPLTDENRRLNYTDPYGVKHYLKTRIECFRKDFNIKQNQRYHSTGKHKDRKPQSQKIKQEKFEAKLKQYGLK